MSIDPKIEEIFSRRLIATKRNDLEELLRCSKDFEDVGTETADLLRANTEGIVAIIQGDLIRAEQLFTEALDGHRRLGHERFAASSMLGLGNANRRQGHLDTALALYDQALEIFDRIDEKNGFFMCLISASMVYQRQGNVAKAIDYLKRAEWFFEIHGTPEDLAMIYGNLAGCYLDVSEYDLSSTMMFKTLDIMLTVNDPIGLAKTYHSLGSLSSHLRDYDEALEWYAKALQMYKDSGDQLTEAMCLAHMGSVYVALRHLEEAKVLLLEGYEIAQALSSTRLVLELATSLCNLHGIQSQFDEVDRILARHENEWALDPIQYAASLGIRGELCAERGDHDVALEYYVRALEIHRSTHRRSSEATIHSSIKALAKKMGDFELYLKHEEASRALESEIRSDELKKKLAVQHKQREIDLAHQESEKHKALLYGTLPREIADRMLRGEDVSGDSYDHAAVLFFDLVGFTRLSSEIGAIEVVQLLDTIFLTCDHICDSHGVTKIKTIGDSYMAVAFPLAQSESCEERLATAAREIHAQRFVSPSGEHIQLRMGLHSGPVVAGVIGSKRLQYDVWGDTVNVASRMESTCEPGRMQVSSEFAEAYLRDEATRSGRSDRLSPRGEIDVKGRGMLSTFWLSGEDS